MKRYMSIGEINEINGWILWKSGKYTFHSKERAIADISSSIQVLEMALKWGEPIVIKKTKSSRAFIFDPDVVEYEKVEGMVFKELSYPHEGYYAPTGKTYVGMVPTIEMASASKKKKEAFFKWRKENKLL